MTFSTIPLFRTDAYLASVEAKVLAVNERRGIVLDQTVFFAAGGGQPGDSGKLERGSGEVEIVTTVSDGAGGEIVHVPSEDGILPEPGELVNAVVDWERRYRHMRMHTALHLLSVVLPFPVTGGSIGKDAGRLDFDVTGEIPAKNEIEERLNTLVAADYQITDEWISDEELLANLDLVKTMKVKPPMGTGRVRLVRIGDIDLQPCGGTHVRATSEIGLLAIGKIESKGRQNRRVRLHFAEES